MEFNPKISLKKDVIARKITMDQLIPYSRDIYSWTYEPYSGGAKFQNGDTIMARITPCLENGKHAYISLLDENEIAFGSTEYIVMRGKKGVSDNKFVYYLTHYPSFKNSAIKSMVGSSGRQRAQTSVLENMTMNLPSLYEQIRIAEILSEIDDKIAVNRRICENLEAQAQALFKHWFIDFAPFKNGQFVESELGMIPEGWRVESIGKLQLIVTDYVANGSFASLKENVKLYQEEEYAYFIRNTDLKSGKFGVYVDKHSYEFLSKSRLYGGEIIISNVGDVGSVFLCPRLNKPMTLGNNIIMVKSEDAALNTYLYLLFRCSFGQGLIRSITGGSAQPKFNKTDFKSLKIIIPSSTILANYVDNLLQMINIIEANKLESSRLSTLRDTLLPKLMSGQIKVNEMEKSL